MELEPIDELFIKRKVHISTVGWITAIISGLILYFLIVNVVNCLVISQSQEIKGLLRLSEETQVEINSIRNDIMLIQLIFGLIAIFYLFSSVGLIHYRKWARKIFVLSSWVFISLSFLGLFFYALAFSKFTSGLIPLNIKEMFDNSIFGVIGILAKIKIMSYAIILIVTLRTLFRISLTFSKKEYNRLFI